ncbi:hypothetical protein OA238_c42580 [Octadecabacter arcticus 238]|uniref:DUF4113 domain-containing protein n=1 Tax=Octadecabacter arcticus 238 TaxID=391616 RepID=M9RWA3_9RHOB|nr:DUF4113 domain-containing protein [Octadecabacter arcticus]AGI74165.1 hypothetical protein OA238_c42580 [Octadecabacter arcticus 238]
MTALDQVNDRFGKKTMVLASKGMKGPWQLRSNHRSPRYTPARLTRHPHAERTPHQRLFECRLSLLTQSYLALAAEVCSPPLLP